MTADIVVKHSHQVAAVRSSQVSGKPIVSPCLDATDLSTSERVVAPRSAIFAVIAAGSGRQSHCSPRNDDQRCPTQSVNAHGMFELV